MIKNNFNEEELETENEPVLAKKEKRKKTGEERKKDRNAVFIVFLLVIIVTIVFWLKAEISDRDKWKKIMIDDGLVNEENENDNEDDGFFVRYKI